MSDPTIGDRDRSTEGRGRTALVTGASSGIGLAMCQLLAAKGYDVVGVARRGDRLAKLRDELESRWAVRAFDVVADLSEPDSPARIVRQLAQDGVTVDFLVNNAGYTDLARYADLSWNVHERRLRVMLLSGLELTHTLLPGMVDRDWGRIINVTSIAGTFIATPSDALYAGIKAMMQRFTESIAAEYAGAGIRCTASVPGFTATEIFDQPSPGLAEKMRSDPFVSRITMAPETVAREAYRAVMMGKRTVVHGWHHKVMGAVCAHAPMPVRRWLAVEMTNAAKLGR